MIGMEIKKYNVTYPSGGGTEFDEGVWEIKTTPKQKTATKLAEQDGYFGVYSKYPVGKKFKIGFNTGNPIREIDDETFVVYFEQAGTPFYFEPCNQTKPSP